MSKINNNSITNRIVYSLIISGILAFGAITFIATEANADEEYGVYHGYNEPVTPRNPVPVVASINPNPIVLGSDTKTITIYGEGFVQGSVVRLDGSDRTTVFVSSSKLVFELVETDGTRLGDYVVTVHNPGPGGGRSNGYTLSVKNKLASASSASSTGSVAGASTSTKNSSATSTKSTTTRATETDEDLGDLAAGVILGENAFMPSGLVQWILLAILILILVIIARKIFGGENKYHQTPLKHA
ncbi:MAG: IPT/TIG domain-containing protein [Patescibacteria group bacterium]